MSSRHPGKAESSSASLPTVRILELAKNATATVRLLSYNHLGAFTHWEGKNPGHSVLCKGTDCPKGLCASGTLWKSWQVVEVWSEHSRLWFAAVLEVTENLELDMRGVAARGQVWDITRPVRRKGKRSSIQGVLTEERDPASFPAPFNVLLVLRSVFHADHIELNKPNPMPPRLTIAPTADEPPRKYAAADQPAERVPYKPMQERLKEHIAGKNGDHS